MRVPPDNSAGGERRGSCLLRFELALMFKNPRLSLRRHVSALFHRRSLRFSSEGTRFILLVLALGVAALNTGNNLLYLLSAMMLSVIVVSGILSERCLKGVTIARRLPQHIFAGQPATVALSITNEKPYCPSFSLRVVEAITDASVGKVIHILHLAPRTSMIRSYPLLVPRRGRHRMETINVTTRFPFGLFIKTARIPLKSEIVAYPSPGHLPEALLDALNAMGAERDALQRGPGDSLYNLRDYSPGDDARNIHWKTSARQGRLVVRETETQDRRQVILALPTLRTRPGGDLCEQSAGDGFERAIVLVASLAAYFQQREFAVRLVLGNHDVPSGKGEDHLYRIFRALALCEATAMTSGPPIPESFLALPDHVGAGSLVFVVLPWEDIRLRAACRGVTRFLEA
jgi:uncharacterized protein (DUF58 family)